MFWLDSLTGDIEEKLKDRIKAGEKLVIRDEKTASGRVHVGSMRGAAIHGVISEALMEAGVENEYFYEINDMDPMDGMPAYLDEAVYRKYMGQPLFTIPSPVGNAKNFAEYYGLEFTGVIEETGFHPSYYRLSDKYRAGEFNGVIRLALEHADVIRRLYKEISNSVKAEDWYPLQVICENCGKIGTTKVTGFDGEKVSYVCMPNMVKWAEGCAHEGSVSPYDGRAKLPWKVEWAAKFKVMNVAIEGAGKDHSTKGGSREVADAICKQVFGHEPPFNVPYEFFLIGGKKMSSSKGNASAARDVADLLPPHIFRLALLGKDINQQVNVDPAGDTIPILFDQFDKLAEKAWSGVDDDDTRLFRFIHFPEEREMIPQRFLPRFSQVAFIVQMPHMDLYKEVECMKGSSLTEDDRVEAALRAKYARFWLDKYADDDFKFELQTAVVPEGARNLSSEQKVALGKVLAYVESNEVLTGEGLHTALHEIRKESGLDAKTFFGALYQSFLGKDSGPKAGWFLSVMDRDFLVSRLRGVSS